MGSWLELIQNGINLKWINLIDLRRISESKTSTPSPVTKSNDAVKASSPSGNASSVNEAAPGAATAAPPVASAASDGSPSVLNALEKLIEKSFDPTSKRGAGPVGSNILRRLGIDEGQFNSELFKCIHINWCSFTR